MYKETVGSNKKTLFFIIAVIVLTMIIFGTIDSLSIHYRAFLQLGILAVLSIMVYTFIRLYITDYTYLLIDDELIFNKKASQADLPLLTIKLERVVNIAPVENYMEVEPIPHNHVYHIKKKLGKNGVYVCVFTKQNGERYKVFFEPTDKLLSMIAKRCESLRTQKGTERF
jgi:hypothetical protein